MTKSSLLKFLHTTEKLKNELRHSYLSTRRRESVAEHCWRLSLMVITLLPGVKEKLDFEKCVKMAIIHDLCEIFAGDTQGLSFNKQGKGEEEEEGMKKLLKMLPDENLKKEICKIWKEFEELKTKEANFVRLLDKLEVIIQHNEADIETWDEIEKKYHYGMAKKHAERYGFLMNFALEVDEEIKNKLKKAGFNPKELSQEDYECIFGK